MRHPEPVKLRKGAWDSEEDTLLRKCIETYGEGRWHLVPQRSGLNRCRKSCRLRWLNYLSPAIKRGHFGAHEVDLMMRLHKLLGNRWSLIAGRLPGRTANDIKNFWNTNLKKQLHPDSYQKEVTAKGKELIQRKNYNNAYTGCGSSNHLVIRPLPRSLAKGTSVHCQILNSHMASTHTCIIPGVLSQERIG